MRLTKRDRPGKLASVPPAPPGALDLRRPPRPTTPVPEVVRPWRLSARAVKVTAGVLAVVLVGGASWLMLRHEVQPSVRTALREQAGAVDFPLYYPSSLPKGIELAEGSAVVRGAVAQFSLNAGGAGTVIVTQQERPRMMEELKKTKQFATAAGPAYLADLNGHTAGFVLTGETLVILSGPGAANGAQLEQIMRSLTEL